MSFKVAIIGAGPAGLMLARLLHLANIQITVFEVEQSHTFRSQGGTLDLRKNSGIAAIRAAGLYDEYLTYCRYDGSAVAVGDKRAHFHLQFAASENGDPEIDRSELRALLVSSLPEDTIRWNKKLRRVGENLDLHFDDCIESGFDLIVGAEGAWSKVRSFLTEESPFFSGIAGYLLLIPDAAETAPEVSKLVNRGNVFSYSDGKSIMAQQMNDKSIYVNAWMRQDEDPHTLETKERFTKEDICKVFSDWAPVLLNILRTTSGEVTCKSLYMVSPGFKWQHAKGVTLLGDAAHLMTPFAGLGVNIAFEDAMKLADAIIHATKDDSQSLDAGIEAFEKDMFVRAERAEHLTCGMMRDMFFTDGIPRSRIFGRFALKKVAYDIHPLVYPFLYPFLAAFVFGTICWNKVRS